MRVELSEWQSVTGLDLPPAVIPLLAYSPKFTVGPDPVNFGKWVLSAKQHVGVAHFGELEVRVRPKVPPYRLVELLVGSIDRIDWGTKEWGWAGADTFVNTIVEAFCSSAERAVNSGILQGYVTEQASLNAVRGRIDLSRQISRNPGLQLPIAVTYDEYTIDVIENQLLAGAGRLLLRLSSLPSRLVRRLRRLEHQLTDVSPTRPSPDPPAPRWTRLNIRYRPAVTLARIVLKSGAFDMEAEGSTRVPALLVDMNQVFEDVVGQGLSGALAGRFTVRLQCHDYLAANRLIPIRPDVIVSSVDGAVAVADVKYKLVGKQGVASDDVFQALAYATKYGLRECTLIYPQQPPVERLDVGNCSIWLRFVDIAQPQEIRTKSIEQLANWLIR